MSTCLASSRVHAPMCLECLLAFVSSAYVLLCLSAYVLECLRFLCANVPCVLICSRANVPCVLTCTCANVPHVLTRLCAYVLGSQSGLRAQVVMCQHALSPLPHKACVTTRSPANMLCLLSK